MAEIVMPRLSDSMEEGTILTWLKQVGDTVAIGDELVEIETDKANMAYEADVAGVLEEILAQEGETLPIGTPIAVVEDGEGPGARAAGPVADDVSPALRESPSSAPPPAQGAEPSASTSTAKGESSGTSASGPGSAAPSSQGVTRDEGTGRVKASPVAKRLARDKGLDLTSIAGSGPSGRIVKADVERAVAAGGGAGAGGAEDAPARSAPPAPGSGPAAPALGPSSSIETAKGQTTYQEPSKLQSTVARRMAESKATAPHFYLEAEVDMSRAVEARGRVKAAAREGEVVPSFNDMVVKACALALREFPRANGAYRDGRFELYSRVNVGVAVAGQDALVVPTVFDADQKGLRQIAAESRALAQRVRDGQITPPELSGGTFTVSNLGMYGIDAFAAVINTPQAGILAVGAIRERPAVRDGAIVPAHLMNVTLACDHRILYGADGAEFLARVRALLEEPLALAL
jgi:pyruvate dehydrogenase E2 component (dihydrolipoamide acetyltransferase)